MYKTSSFKLKKTLMQTSISQHVKPNNKWTRHMKSNGLANDLLTVSLGKQRQCSTHQCVDQK